MGASIGSVFHAVFFLLLAGAGVLLIMLAIAITSSKLDSVDGCRWVYWYCVHDLILVILDALTVFQGYRGGGRVG